jgi:indolepyruvate ferredoxin oxidoreductase alpha subunit
MTSMTGNIKQMMNGNEAVAWAALFAGVDILAHYPGSPVNMVEVKLKQLSKQFSANIKFNDSVNEHVAALVAAGASFSGARTLLVMKHVGLNIAADPLNYVGYTGVKGGMVIIVGTDPGANSSTNEQDVHWYVPQFNFPLFEPTSVQQIFDQTHKAFELSEKYQVPVMLFLPGRICHNSDSIEIADPKTQSEKQFFFTKDPATYINVGEKAIRNHKALLQKIKRFSEDEFFSGNFFNSEAKTGIITRGISFGHAHEAIERLGLSERIHLLNAELVYPINKKTLLEFAKNKTEIIVIEDQDGFLESQIKTRCFNEIRIPVHGKDIFPNYGELSFAQVYNHFIQKFNLTQVPQIAVGFTDIPERLGTFCEGCPHTASYFSIDQVLKPLDGIIGGDIGCSSLPPFRADWLLCMNAGIGVSQGIASVSEQTLISTGGDGSFFHGGLLSLMNAVQNNTDLLHVVFDNKTIAMTGHQISPSASINYHILLKAIGVDNVTEVYAFKPGELKEALEIQLGKKGVRVIWVKGNCAMLPDENMINRRASLSPRIETSKCGTCRKCYEELACPAIHERKDLNEFYIDLTTCMRCGVCSEICPNGAIHIESKLEH